MINDNYNEFMYNFKKQKQKKTYESERLLQFVKNKKTMKRKIKIMLINIWFNYSFHSYFRLKMLSWSSNFFSFNLIPIFEKN